MAVLYISEYAESGHITGPVAVGAEPAIFNQTVTVTSSSAQSIVFKTNTRLVRLHTDVPCAIRFGSNPTAGATDARLAANQTEYFQVAPVSKVAVITVT